MKARLIATVATIAATIGLSSGLFALSAAAATSTTTAVVFDATSSASWTGDEVTGATAYDTATVTGDGSVTPTGTVTYSFFDNGTCTSDANTTMDPVTLNGDGSVPDSEPTAPLAAGSYSFEAGYGGDTNNDSSPPSSCEPFTVGTATTTESTTVFDAGSNSGWSGMETAGATAYDTSTATGVPGFTPSGTVTYAFFANGSCSGDALTTDLVSLNGDGSVPNSGSTGPLGAGSYSFSAVYSGDANYSASPVSGCEPFTVGEATPSAATTVDDATSDAVWAGTELAGASAYDTATVTGASALTPSGTVTYSFFTNDSCFGDAVMTDLVTLNDDGSVPDSGATGPLSAGGYSFDAVYSGDINYAASPTSSCEPFSVGLAASTTTTAVFDGGNHSGWAGDEVTGASAYDTAAVIGVSPFTPSGTVIYSFFTDASCTGNAATTDPVTLNGDGSAPDSGSTGSLGAGSYSFDAVYGGDANYGASPVSACERFTVGKATPSAATLVLDAGTNSAWSDMETTGASAYDTATVAGVTDFTPSGAVTYSFFTNASCTGTAATTDPVTVSGDGSVSSSTPTTALGPGSYSFHAVYSGDANYTASTASSCEPFTVAQGLPTAPTITDLPSSAVFGGSLLPVVATNGDGTKSVTSSTTGVCTLSGSTVVLNGVGTCTLTAQVAGTVNFARRSGSPQSFPVRRATPSSPSVANVPGGATELTSFVATVATTGDGKGSVASGSPGVCKVGSDGVTVTFVGFGTCTLTASVAQGAHYLAGMGGSQAFPVNPAARGYWLVGADGGIFSFGAAGFHGSMGGLALQRPVVGITPTASRNGYWLVASDGGIFSFGDSSFYGSIPGIGLLPAGSGEPNSLDAPIVGMVPSTSGHGYFMVASDGGVFAFGDARFEGSCPGIGGCEGAAVGVMPDSTGNGYWLVTNVGAVYAFGDAPFYGSPSGGSGAVVDAVATPDGHGYWILYADGAVFGFGDAVDMGAPLGYVNSFNPATSIFPTADGKGYWVAAARGDVFAYGDAPYMGSMAAAGLNGLIIAGFGF